MTIKPKDNATDKFNTLNWIGPEVFSKLNLPSPVKKSACKLASAGLATTTKQQYNSALNMARRMEEKMGVKIEFPWSTETVIQFIVFMRDVNKPSIAASTMNNYIAGVRMQHLMRGFSNVNLKNDIVKLLIRGAANLDAVTNRLANKKSRQPVTWEIMKKIKANLHVMKGSEPWKKGLWLIHGYISVQLFSHELLAIKLYIHGYLSPG